MSLLSAFIIYLATGFLLTNLLIMGVRHLAKTGNTTTAQKAILAQFEERLEVSPYFVLIIFSVLWFPILFDTLFFRKK